MKNYSSLSLSELKELAKRKGIEKVYQYKKNELISILIKKEQAEDVSISEKKLVNNPQPVNFNSKRDSNSSNKGALSKNEIIDTSDKIATAKKGVKPYTMEKTDSSKARTDATDQEKVVDLSQSDPQSKKVETKDSGKHESSAQKPVDTIKYVIKTPSFKPSERQQKNNDGTSNAQANVKSNTTNSNLINRQENSKNSAIVNLEQYITVEGALEIVNDGSHGIVRTSGIRVSDEDAYIPGSQIKKLGLRGGDIITGIARPPKDKEKYLSMLRVDKVWGQSVESPINRKSFQKLTPIFPNRQMILETSPDILSTRIIDILMPIGFGQRALLVAPPKAGKTTLMKEIANGISANHPDTKIIVLLVGERPEEVTDMSRSIKGEMFASNFDEPAEQNCRIAELALEKARRMVEMGEDVVILMDSITRLARSYNISVPPSGRTLSGGFDPAALYPPKRFFGAARNFEEGGSLTIIATALIDTGSRMDDLIYEEFKGTGNMEIILDRELANKRIFPAIDIQKSGTRNEELLLKEDNLLLSWKIRKMLDMIKKEGESMTELLVYRMRKSKSNYEFLNSLHEA